MLISEEEAQKEYDEILDKMQPLTGINCNSFSQLLKSGDPIAYDEGFSNYIDDRGYELKIE